jgi:hypothetical protein
LCDEFYGEVENKVLEGVRVDIKFAYDGGGCRCRNCGRSIDGVGVHPEFMMVTS